MRMLVTGGLGFIGSNFIRYMLENHKDCRIVNLDLLTYAGNKANLASVEENSRYSFVEGDIADGRLVDRLIKEHRLTVIINFAAESHVDRSIENPGIFVQTNVVGTQTLLDAAYRNNVERFIQISTDEVYGSLGEEGLFSEDTPLSPNSPYSASKAAADMLVRSYYETYQLPVNITRCSNNYGPYQHTEKLIPLMITNALQDRSLPVYGDGKNIRDWLHVYDHCRAIEMVLLKGKAGEVYNIGGNNEKRNIDIVREIIRQLGKSEDLLQFVEDRKGHDRRYAINPEKIVEELGWVPSYDFERGLQETIKWYENHRDWWMKTEDAPFATA